MLDARRDVYLYITSMMHDCKFLGFVFHNSPQSQSIHKKKHLATCMVELIKLSCQRGKNGRTEAVFHLNTIKTECSSELKRKYTSP